MRSTCHELSETGIIGFWPQFTACELSCLSRRLLSCFSYVRPQPERRREIRKRLPWTISLQQGCWLPNARLGRLMWLEPRGGSRNSVLCQVTGKPGVATPVSSMTVYLTTRAFSPGCLRRGPARRPKELSVRADEFERAG
jgi:hypothetical protein